MKASRFPFRYVLLVLALALFPPSMAEAVLTEILDSPDRHNEPNLIGTNPFPANANPSVLETLYGESNLVRIDDSQDRLFEIVDATATAKIVAKFSSITERFGYLRDDGFLQNTLQARDRGGSGFHPEVFDVPGAGVIDPAVSGPILVLGMNDIPAYSTPRRNLSQADQMVTFQIVGNDGHPDNAIGSFVFGFEDTPPNYGTLTYDGDFQDLVVEVAGIALVPEPSCLSVAALALVLLGGLRTRST